MTVRLWRHRATLVGAVFIGLLCGCAPPTTGTVTGGIAPCSALGAPGEPQYAAGTVVVLQGTIRRQSTGPGSWREILPAHVVTAESVGVNQTYSFQLKPGSYLLVLPATPGEHGDDSLAEHGR